MTPYRTSVCSFVSALVASSNATDGPLRIAAPASPTAG